jgi:hypothetical protein
LVGGFLGGAPSAVSTAGFDLSVRGTTFLAAAFFAGFLLAITHVLYA